MKRTPLNLGVVQFSPSTLKVGKKLPKLSILCSTTPLLIFSSTTLTLLAYEAKKGQINKKYI